MVILKCFIYALTEAPHILLQGAPGSLELGLLEAKSFTILKVKTVYHFLLKLQFQYSLSISSQFHVLQAFKLTEQKKYPTAGRVLEHNFLLHNSHNYIQYYIL